MILELGSVFGFAGHSSVSLDEVDLGKILSIPSKGSCTPHPSGERHTRSSFAESQGNASIPHTFLNQPLPKPCIPYRYNAAPMMWRRLMLDQLLHCTPLHFDTTSGVLLY